MSPDQDKLQNSPDNSVSQQPLPGPGSIITPVINSETQQPVSEPVAPAQDISIQAPAPIASVPALSTVTASAEVSVPPTTQPAINVMSEPLVQAIPTQVTPSEPAVSLLTDAMPTLATSQPNPAHNLPAQQFESPLTTAPASIATDGTAMEPPVQEVPVKAVVQPLPSPPVSLPTVPEVPVDQAAVRSIVDAPIESLPTVPVQPSFSASEPEPGATNEQPASVVAPIDVMQPENVYATVAQESPIEDEIPAQKPSKPKNSRRRILIAIAWPMVILLLAVGGVLLFVRQRSSAPGITGNVQNKSEPVAQDGAASSEQKPDAAASSEPAAGQSSDSIQNPTPTLAGDTERKKDMNTIHAELESYYTRNGRFPSLEQLNSADFRKQSMPNLTENDLKDPDGTSALLASAPGKLVYSYQPTNDEGQVCDNKKVECQDYTLTAIFSTGERYKRLAIE